MSIPIYQKIINFLIQKINRGEYSAGDRLPSEKELMELFQTSRITVTRALQELDSKGIIYKIKGKGSFISPENAERLPPKQCPKIISLVLPHKEDFFSGGQQYSRQIFKNCQKRGYLCSIHFSENSSKKEKRIFEEIVEHNVAGAIIYPISNKNIGELSRMSIEGLPIVLLDRRLRELDLPCVYSDNFKGAIDAVNFLTSAGHKRIAFVGAMDSEAVSQRYQGYCRALTRSRIVLDPELAITKFSSTTEEKQAVLGFEEAVEILGHLLDRGTTAVFAVNDITAYTLMRAASRRNIKIPEQLSLVGFDNLEYFTGFNTELTSVAQDFKSIASECVSTIVNIIEKGQTGEPAHIVIPTKLVRGETVAGIR